MYSVEQTLVEIVQRDSKRTKLTIPAEGPARLKLRQDDDQSANLFLEFAAKIVLAVRPNKSTMRMSLMLYNGEARVMNKSVTAHEDDIKKLVDIDAFGHAKLTDCEKQETADDTTHVVSEVETTQVRKKCDDNCKCQKKKSVWNRVCIPIIQNIFVVTGGIKLLEYSTSIMNVTNIWLVLLIGTPLFLAVGFLWRKRE